MLDILAIINVFIFMILGYIQSERGETAKVVFSVFMIALNTFFIYFI